MRVGLLFLFLMLFAGFASAETDLFDYESLDLRLEINNFFDISERSTFTNVQEVSALMTWYPVDDYRQTSVEVSTSPESEFKDDGFFFEWDKPQERHFELSVYSTLNTTSGFRKISEKVDFPLRSVPYEFSPYLKSYEITDANDEIASIASRLAQGEDDAFIMVSKLAGWVEENVEYDLSTTTADASQKSSWVLENKVGVCDELTSLFISMSRSVGIPARFVSGVSYSNVNGENNGWGPHGWAEVYLPEVGWVPVDVTYKELGYVDATHIKLKTSVDAKESSVQYSVTGQGANLVPGKLDFDVDVLGGELKQDALVDFDLEVLEDDVNFGSYNLVHLTIKNKNNYYASGRLFLLNVTGIEVFDRNSRAFVMPPRSEENYYWKIKVDEDLDKDYVYTFPLSVRMDHLSANETFKAYARGKTLSESYIDSRIATSASSSYSDVINIQCVSPNKELYLEESASISCSVENTGEKSLGLKVCLEKNCSFANIAAGKSKDFDYVISFEDIGITTAKLSAESASASKEAYIVFEVKDEPNLQIKNLTNSQTIGFEDFGDAKFMLTKTSNSPAENVVLTIENDLVSQVWEIDRMDYGYEIHFTYSGQDLKLGPNDFKINLTYENAEGRKYFEGKEFTVEMVEESFAKRTLSWLNIINIRLNSWFERNIMKEASTSNNFKLLLKRT